MKHKTPRRWFNAVTKEQLRNLQVIKDQLRQLRSRTPVDREPELEACLDVINEQQNDLLGGKDLRFDMHAVAQVKACGAFRRNIEREAAR